MNNWFNFNNQQIFFMLENGGMYDIINNNNIWQLKWYMYLLSPLPTTIYNIIGILLGRFNFHMSRLQKSHPILCHTSNPMRHTNKNKNMRYDYQRGVKWLIKTLWNDTKILTQKLVPELKFVNLCWLY